MRAYSLNLPQRIIAAMDAVRAVAAVAERYAVSPRSVRRFRQQWREQDTLTARPSLIARDSDICFL